MRNHATNGATLRRPHEGRWWRDDHKAGRCTDTTNFHRERKFGWRRFRGRVAPLADSRNGHWGARRADKSRAWRRYHRAVTRSELADAMARQEEETC